MKIPVKGKDVAEKTPGSSEVSEVNMRRILLIFALCGLLFFLLTVRLGWHQIIKGEEYTQIALDQQTADRIIPASRGTIYDTNHNELALSAGTNTIWVRPKQVKSNGDTAEEIERNAQSEAAILAEALEMSQEEVLGIITSDSNLIKVAKYVDTATAEFIKEQRLSGIEIVEDIKRYYPLGQLAAHVIGATTDDNRGMFGIELEYNSHLSGVDGRWITNKDISGNALAYGVEKYYKAEDGLSGVLTLDGYIQHFVENALDAALVRTKAKRAMCLVMDIKNGDILCMAQTPKFDLNDPRTPLDPVEAAKVEAMNSEQKLEYWNAMWRNFCVSDVYEPGSTFKLISASIALDSGVTNPQETYNCGSSIRVADHNLKCWYYPRDHGKQTFKEAIRNSCNPVLVQVGAKIGLERYYEGLDSFGLTSKTGIDFPGEGGNILQPKKTAGPVGLATMAYGQGIAVTPVSLITAVSSIANGGILMKPRLVKEFVDSEGNVVEVFEPEVVGRSISKQTAGDMLDIMEFVVEDGGAGAAKLAGYRIGGKTGTASKPVPGGYSEEDVFASFIGVGPIEDPRVAVLVIVDSPRGVLYGSVTAAPVAGEIFKELFRYMGIEPNYTAEQQRVIDSGFTTVPELSGMSIEEAISVLSSCELTYKISPKADTVDGLAVVDHYPKEGERIRLNSAVVLYHQ